MADKKKKQHYVPQCYLEAWRIPDTHQVYVYDTKKVSSRKSNIKDVASENYFYDFTYDSSLKPELVRALNLCPDGNPESFDEHQFLENFFSEYIEGDYSKLLDKIISKGKTWGPWEQKNCLVVSNDEKRKLSFYIAIQRLRAKEVRDTLSDTVDCLAQAFKDMNVSQEMYNRYIIDGPTTDNIHREIILDFEELFKLTLIFENYVWLFRRNTTGSSFYTSDNPISSIPHKSNQFYSMGGLLSEGVEICFPISPTLLLTMFDSKYFPKIFPGFEKRDRYMIDMDDNRDVDFHNSVCAVQSTRCVFSCDSNFALLDEVEKRQPGILNKPHSVMSWGGKDYYPSNK